MNFLAHLHLAEATPESRLGNLLGDFVKGLPWDDRYSDQIWQGIMEHRYLDVFTDNHPAWKRSRARLKDEQRRYAGIVIDVFYDFFLHRHWQQFNPWQSVEDFVDEVHRDLKSIQNEAPAEMAGVLAKMIRQEWLLGYARIEGIEKTLGRVARSSPNLSAIKGLSSELIEHMDGFEEDFVEFYPDALKEVIVIREKTIPESYKTNKKL